MLHPVQHMDQYIVLETSKLDQQIHSIMAEQAQQVVKPKIQTSDDVARQQAKQAILNQYAEVSDGEEYPFDCQQLSQCLFT